MNATLSVFRQRRRSLLLGAALTPAAVLAADMRQVRPAAPLPSASEAEEPQSGYHETEHIRTYYRLASLM
ncbi:transcriptional initiation protein Tat [Noviherbaspirillum galbum]|uniref:Transcriptional initiation protein Tat n=1 Tax=Noviherbaspirillum galbum TaxID=2709383 RepID=A0A6B3SGJ5_9BURK|nr:transcriptional initiation protein Tat [Noviherbaspirillum galbum]NEX59984.1 transcriptional initiation protein Tat [Noviherbaspirillum galbum]